MAIKRFDLDNYITTKYTRISGSFVYGEDYGYELEITLRNVNTEEISYTVKYNTKEEADRTVERILEDDGYKRGLEIDASALKASFMDMWKDMFTWSGVMKREALLVPEVGEE